MKIKKSPAFIFIFLLMNFSLVSQPAQPVIEPLQKLFLEAPKSFIATELGSAEVELFVQGYWEALVASSGTFSFGSPSPALYNPVPLFFQQRPDIYMLLILQKQWWTEASVTDDLSRTLFAIGYTGLENDFLKEVRLGNSGISMRNYPNMAFGTTKNAFGIRAQAEDSDRGISADAMIRWDSLSYTTKRFLGTLALEETIQAAASWLRGRRFLLPGSPVSSLVLREVYNGNERILGTEEYSLRNAFGFIELNQEPIGILYADYTVDSVTDTVELYSKNGSNDYEIKNLYAISSGGNPSDFYIRSLKTGLPESSYSIRLVGSSLIEVTKGDNPAYSSQDFSEPFLSTDPWIYEPVPLITETTYPPMASVELASLSFKETSGIQIEQNALTESITVLRNGIATTLFSYDPASGAINLTPPPKAGEEILIRYALETSMKGSNGLVFGLGLGWRQGETALWQAAIGGRWPFPGQSYAEAGQQHPSWLGLSLAAESPPTSISNSSFSWSSSVFSRFVRPEASGIYRIAGMEDSGDFASPFRPDSDVNPNLSSSVAVDASFPETWPEYDAKVHVQNETSGSLRFSASGASATTKRFINYQEPVPLALFKKFVFFLRNESSAGVSLTLHVGNGSAGLTINRLMIDTPDEWVRVEVNLEGIPRISAIDSRGESVFLDCDGVTYESISTAGFVYFEFTDFLDGAILIDELHLEEPYAGFDSGLNGFIQLRSPDTPDDLFTNARVTAKAGSDASSLWTFSLNSDLGAGFTTGPARWRVNVMPLAVNNSFDLGASYSLMIPRDDFPIRFEEYFFRQADNRLFAHKLQAAVGMSPFQAKVIQETVDNSYLFMQTWFAGIDVPNWIDIKINAKNLMPFSVLDTMPIPETWLESWKFLAPHREAEASKRVLGADLGAAPFSALTVSSSQTFETNAFSESLLKGKIAWPIKISPLSFIPFYERRIHVAGTAAPRSFAEDIVLWGDTMQNCWPLIIEYPFQDLFKAALDADFQALSALYEKAEYQSGTGLSFERPIGYGYMDLWLPAKVQAGIGRKLQKTFDTFTDSMTYTVKLDGSAFNVFSKFGVTPIFTLFDLDEYFWQLDTKLVRFSSDARFFPWLNAEYSASLSTELGSSLGVRLQGKYNEDRTGIAWEGGLESSYNKKMTRTWLEALIDLTKKKEQSARAVKPSAKVNIVWAWFDGIAAEIPVLRDIFSAGIRLNYEKNEIAPYKIQLSERYETKYTIAKSLSLSVYASMNETMRFYPSYVLWGFGYELGINARVSF